MLLNTHTFSLFRVSFRKGLTGIDLAFHISEKAVDFYSPIFARRAIKLAMLAPWIRRVWGVVPFPVQLLAEVGTTPIEEALSVLRIAFENFGSLSRNFP